MNKLQNAVQESVLLPYLIEALVTVFVAFLAVSPLLIGKLVGGDLGFPIVVLGYALMGFIGFAAMAEAGRE